jgi:hypothetical protein
MANKPMEAVMEVLEATMLKKRDIKGWCHVSAT